MDGPEIDAAPPCTTANAFGNPIASPVGGTGVALAIGKFDNGAVQDLVVSVTTDTVTMLGNNTGAFGTAVSVGTASTAVGVDDFNILNDTRQDLILIKGTTAIIRLQNGANQAFLAEQPLDGPFTNAENSGSGFLNDGDGKSDLVVHDDGGNTPFQQLSGTPGTFQRGTSVGAAGDDLLVVKDIDTDGNDDVVLVDAAGNVKLALSNGTGAIGTPTVIATDATGKGAVFGDFDGDTFPDLMVATAAGGVVYLQNAATPGTFIKQTGAFLEILGDRLMVGDVNKDGLDDIVTPTAVVMQCPTTRVFTQKEPIDATPPALLVDVTGNGKLDLLRLSGTDVIVRVQ